jgi:hypothetical protein
MRKLLLTTTAFAVCLSGVAAAGSGAEIAKVKKYKTVIKSFGVVEGVDANGFGASGKARPKGKLTQGKEKCFSRIIAIRKVTGKTKTTVATRKTSRNTGFFGVKNQNQVQGNPPFGPGRYQAVARKSKVGNTICKKGKSEIVRAVPAAMVLGDG